MIKSYQNNDKEILLDNEETDESMVKRQYYVYKSICNDEIKQSNLRFLLDKLSGEIQHQYKRKAQIETRFGFVMALWGVLQVVSYEVFKGTLANDGLINIIFFLFSSVLSISLIVLLCFGMWSKCIYAFEFSDWNSNLITAIGCPEIMLARFLEGYKNAYICNDRAIVQKGKILNFAIAIIGLYIVILHGLMIYVLLVLC